MTVTRIEDLQLTLQPDRVIQRLRLQRTPGHQQLARDFIERVQELAQPRALYVELPVKERSDSWVQIGDTRFTSAILARHTQAARHAFPYLITLGPRVEEAASSGLDMLEQFCLHEVANLALDQAREQLRERVEQTSGLEKLCSLAPGSLADWPITEQRALFQLLGETDELLGVRLTESCLMLPQKSLSGIIFPSDQPFVSCRYCETVDCSGRQVAFDPTVAGAAGAFGVGEGQTPCHP